MHYRILGRTGFTVSSISFGVWGRLDDSELLAALNQAIDCGVNFIDTAGRSEPLVAQWKRDRRAHIVVATQASSANTRESLTAQVEDSLRNLSTDALDLLQLDCDGPEVLGYLDDLVTAGKIKHYGICAKSVEDALKAIEYPNVKTIQIVIDPFRMRQAELLFAEAEKKNVGIIARVAPEPAEELRALVPEGVTLSQFTLRWMLMFDAVTCAMPAIQGPDQVQADCAAAHLRPLNDKIMQAVEAIHQE